MADSTQKMIGRNRAPRVQITYDVEIGNAIEKHEIPFVVGIMADLSRFTSDTKPADYPSLKDPSRSFVEIDRDNFGDVMSKLKPSISVTDALDENGADSGGQLHFKSMDDFNPAQIARRVSDIKRLQEERSALRDILTKLDSNDALYAELKRRIDANSLDGIGAAARERIAHLRPTHDAENAAGEHTDAPADAGTGDGADAASKTKTK